MGKCACEGIKVAVFGALFVANSQGWGFSVDPWLLAGILLMIAGALKAIMPHCPMHPDKGMAAAKPKRR